LQNRWVPASTPAGSRVQPRRRSRVPAHARREPAPAPSERCLRAPRDEVQLPHEPPMIRPGRQRSASGRAFLASAAAAASAAPCCGPCQLPTGPQTAPATAAQQQAYPTRDRPVQRGRACYEERRRQQQQGQRRPGGAWRCAGAAARRQPCAGGQGCNAAGVIAVARGASWICGLGIHEAACRPVPQLLLAAHQRCCRCWLQQLTQASRWPCASAGAGPRCQLPAAGTPSPRRRHGAYPPPGARHGSPGRRRGRTAAALTRRPPRLPSPRPRRCPTRARRSGPTWTAACR
jgi:hypothetical protein